LLTSGDYRSDMIPASRCGCCMWSPAGPQAVLCRVARPAQGDRAPCAAPRGRRPGPTSTSSS